jgi:uncharacterized protein
MKTSPFIYGTTVSGESFNNREKEIEKLRNNLLGGINTMIISPRRWGKTSLVNHVTSLISADNSKVKIVSIDLFTVNSQEEFLERFAEEVLKASSTKWEERVKNSKKIFRNIIPKIQISVDPVNNLSLSFDWKEIRKHADEILNLPETIAVQKKIKIIVCIDEFQSISGFPDYENFEKMLRSVWQNQKHVTYCIYGSMRHMMSEIFNSQSKPFYRFGDIMMLQKIERTKWISYIMDGFIKTGKYISDELAARITDLMQCHSWYVQQLSHYTWNLSKKNTSSNDIIRALDELLSANMPLYQKETEILSTTQLNLLKAVAKGEKQLTSMSVMNDYRLGSPHNVSKNKDLLIRNDVIGYTGDSYFFLDPAFELWFRKSFFNESYLKE